MYPVGLGDRLSQCVVYDYHLWYCVEIISDYHDVIAEFADIADLHPSVPKEIISGPSPNDQYCLWVNPGQEELNDRS